MRYPTAPCKNCNVNSRKDFMFCPYCGQQTKEQLTVGLLFYNTIINYFSFDARFFKSIPPLLFKPGYLAKTFIEGKRTTYLHPAQLYLFLSVLFFFLITTLVVSENIKELDDALTNIPIALPEIEDSLSVNKLNENVLNIENQLLSKTDSLDSLLKEDSNSIALGKLSSSKLDSLIGLNAPEMQILMEMGMKENAGLLKQKLYSQALKFYKQRSAGTLLNTINETLPIAVFILLPIFAFLLQLLFFRRGGYANHLVFSFYFFSFVFFIFTLQLIANLIIDIQDWIDFLFILSIGVYLTFSIKEFYQIGWSTSIIKTIVHVFFFLLFVIPSAVLLLFFYGFIMY